MSDNHNDDIAYWITSDGFPPPTNAPIRDRYRSTYQQTCTCGEQSAECDDCGTESGRPTA